MADEAPKIQIDSDWKKQAQQEKERLAAEVDRKPAAGATPAGGAKPAAGEPGIGEAEPAEEGQAVGPEGIPLASFGEVVAMLGTQVFMFMGEIADPIDGRARVSLPLAKHYIDLLSVLEEKTKGNVSADEKKQLDQLLYEARMRYVQLASGGIGGLGPRRPGKGG